MFVPALQLIWALTLRFAPIRYLNNKTASRIFASPAIIGCIAVLAVLAAFWNLYEVATMLHLLTRIRHGEPLRAWAVFRDAFCSLVRVFLPQNLPLLLYGAALIPLTNFFLAANHLTQFAVPEYLWGLLKARSSAIVCYLLWRCFLCWHCCWTGLWCCQNFCWSAKALAVRLRRACTFCAAAPGSCLGWHCAGC